MKQLSIALYHLAEEKKDEKIVEAWVEMGYSGCFQQLGIELKPKEEKEILESRFKQGGDKNEIKKSIGH